MRVLLTGDAFGGKFLPALTRPYGGDGVGYPNTLTKALPLTRDVDMIITGHGGVAKPQDLEVHRDFIRDFLDSTRQAKKAGLTAEAAAKAWRLPARYAGYGAQPANVLGAMEWIYRQLPSGVRVIRFSAPPLVPPPPPAARGRTPRPDTPR